MKWVVGLFSFFLVFNTAAMALENCNSNADSDALSDELLQLGDATDLEGTNEHPGENRHYLGCVDHRYQCGELARSQGYNYYSVERSRNCRRFDWACYGHH